MNCGNTYKQLDEYLDGTLDGAASAALERHAGECSDCGRALAQALALKSRLAGLPVEGPGTGFFDQALRVAAEQSLPNRRGRIAPAWYAGALAAGLSAIVLVSLLGNPVEQVAPAQGIAQVAMAIEETRTINLVFASEEALEDVSLTVVLPDGVELASYPGQGRVLWSTQLRPGKNVLPLELVALGGSGGELVATMRRDGKEKVFRVNIAVLAG